jgi:voltage-gated potassium channel
VAVRDLDISRKTFIIMVKRSGRTIIPKGDTVLRVGDEVVLYSQKKLGEPVETDEESLS